ncbi:hypothetical protein PORCAN_1229 [Porphyromonas crevioricanis JCM 13913]|nr:hypothetical protein PORCAN_1229 [Porphyromonas crevioricanis JCM 13913]
MLLHNELLCFCLVIIYYLQTYLLQMLPWGFPIERNKDTKE